MHPCVLRGAGGEGDWDFKLMKFGRKKKKDWRCIDVQFVNFSININIKYLLNIKLFLPFFFIK